MKNFLVLAEDLPLAPGFPSTTISSSGYDPPSFYTTSTDQAQTRLYDSSYRDQDLYPGEPGYNRNQNSYSIYSSGTPGLSVDLPSPDSGIGDQVYPDISMSIGEFDRQILFSVFDFKPIKDLRYTAFIKVTLYTI